MISQRDDVDTEDWKNQLQKIRRKQSDFVTDTNARGTPYILGVPSPWLAFESLSRPASEGFEKIDVTVDPPFLVLTASIARSCAPSRSIAHRRWMPSSRRSRSSRSAWTTPRPFWRSGSFPTQSCERRPVTGSTVDWALPGIVSGCARSCRISARFPPRVRRYYEKHFLSLFNNPHNVDLAADMLWEITSPKECDASLQRFDSQVWSPLDRAIELSTEMAETLPAASTARDRFEETRQRLVAYRCYNRTLRNLCAWIAGVHGYLKAENETEKTSRRAMVREMVASELANTEALLHLWNTATVDFMPIKCLWRDDARLRDEFRRSAAEENFADEDLW